MKFKITTLIYLVDDVVSLKLNAAWNVGKALIALAHLC